MNNFDAIGQLDVEKMENFLDQVFLTGLNTGMHAATLNDTPEVQAELLDRNPFDLAWLSAEAEKATLGEPAEDGDGYLLDALTTYILRSACIPLVECEQIRHIDSFKTNGDRA